MIILNSLFPVIALIFLGCVLKRTGFTNEVYLKTSDNLVYFIFFPVMLFWKIGSASFDQGFPFQLLSSVFLALVVIILSSLTAIRIFNIAPFKCGSFAQSCYRFNTYIGVAVVLNSLGSEGIQLFGIIISLAIPFINIAAVSTLIWFDQKTPGSERSISLVVKALFSNPLIIGCIAGILYGKYISHFPEFIDNSLSLVSMVTLPLALISIGGSLSFEGFRENVALSGIASALKLLLFPILGYFCLRLFNVSGTAFQVGMIFFSLPTSTAIYVLSAQMNSDTKLASTAILVSTFLSFPVLSCVFLYWF